MKPHGMSFRDNQPNKEYIMRKRMMDFRAVLVLFTLSMLLLPISAMASGDGAWITTASPGYFFLVEEAMFNNEKHLVMTVLEPGYKGAEVYFGSELNGGTHKYLLKPLNAEASDMIITWELTSVTQATATVDSCTRDCLWDAGEVVSLNKFFGDMSATSLLKTGQTESYADYDDGYYQMGVTAAGPRFTDNGDGTVTDHHTGLIWLKESDCFGVLNWYDAMSACKELASGSCGLSDGSKAGDWRLPNFNELKSIVNNGRNDPAINTDFFPNTMSDGYWSSTTSPDWTNWAFLMEFFFGGGSSDDKSYDGYYVRAVRGGQ